MTTVKHYMLELWAYMFGLSPYMCEVLLISTDRVRYSDTVYMCIDELHRSSADRFTTSSATIHVTA